MTVEEIIAMQRRKCEADKAARMRPRVQQAPRAAQARPPMSAAERERAFMEDRTYDGKTPEGNMASIMRKENPDEYVARDGTRTFVPWRYVSMMDLELPDNGNPYRKPEEENQARKPVDPWGRPSGYAGTGTASGYDPWGATGTIASAQGPQGDGLVDDWLAPAPAAQQAPYVQESGWDSWMAPATGSVPAGNGQGPAEPPPVDTSGTLDLMRSMRTK